MDPQASWDRVIDAWNSCDWYTVVDAADALLFWLERGGFAPETTESHVGADWNRVVAQAACQFALKTATEVIEHPEGIPPSIAFILSCRDCDVDGPLSFEAAIKAGWTSIEYVPTAIRGNFVGDCPGSGND